MKAEIVVVTNQKGGVGNGKKSIMRRKVMQVSITCIL